MNANLTVAGVMVTMVSICCALVLQPHIASYDVTQRVIGVFRGARFPLPRKAKVGVPCSTTQRPLIRWVTAQALCDRREQQRSLRNLFLKTVPLGFLVIALGLLAG